MGDLARLRPVVRSPLVARFVALSHRIRQWRGLKVTGFVRFAGDSAFSAELAPVEAFASSVHHRAKAPKRQRRHKSSDLCRLGEVGSWCGLLLGEDGCHGDLKLSECFLVGLINLELQSALFGPDLQRPAGLVAQAVLLCSCVGLLCAWPWCGDAVYFCGDHLALF